MIDVAYKNVTQVDNVEEGLELLIQEKEAGNPFDLIITDMHYPMRKGEEGDFDAGEKLLGILKERGIDTKVIICSSLNIKIVKLMDASGIPESVTGKWNYWN